MRLVYSGTFPILPERLAWLLAGSRKCCSNGSLVGLVESPVKPAPSLDNFYLSPRMLTAIPTTDCIPLIDKFVAEMQGFLELVGNFCRRAAVYDVRGGGEPKIDCEDCVTYLFCGNLCADGSSVGVAEFSGQARGQFSRS